MGGESGKLQDVAWGQLVDCVPPEPEPLAPQPPGPPPPTPTTAAAHATIEQTGADPPPE